MLRQPLGPQHLWGSFLPTHSQVKRTTGNQRRDERSFNDSEAVYLAAVRKELHPAIDNTFDDMPTSMICQGSHISGLEMLMTALGGKLLLSMVSEVGCENSLSPRIPNSQFGAVADR